MLALVNGIQESTTGSATLAAPRDKPQPRVQLWELAASAGRWEPQPGEAAGGGQAQVCRSQAIHAEEGKTFLLLARGQLGN